jgi:hypothetical protein
MRSVVLLLVPILLVLFVTSMQSQNAKDEGWSQLLPPGEGRELVLTSCATCHNVKVVVHARKDRAAWIKTVGDMIQRSAPIFPEEIEPITDYLSRTFGPDTPTLVNINAANREDLEKLPDFKPEIVAQILEARNKAGAFKNPDELRAALGMEREDFEKIRYLLKYAN